MNLSAMADAAGKVKEISDQLEANPETAEHVAAGIIETHGHRFLALPTGWKSVLKAIARFILTLDD